METLSSQLPPISERAARKIFSEIFEGYKRFFEAADRNLRAPIIDFMADVERLAAKELNAPEYRVFQDAVIGKIELPACWKTLQANDPIAAIAVKLGRAAARAELWPADDYFA